MEKHDYFVIIQQGKQVIMEKHFSKMKKAVDWANENCSGRYIINIYKDVDDVPVLKIERISLF